MQSEYYTYLERVLTTEGGSPVCANISEKIRLLLIKLIEWAYQHKEMHDDIAKFHYDHKEKDLRSQLCLDDIFRTTPIWTRNVLGSDNFSYVKTELENICRNIIKELVEKQMLDTQIYKYYMMFNMIEVQPKCHDQDWHNDFGRLEVANHNINAFIPLTDYPEQGGTMFRPNPSDDDDIDTYDGPSEMPSRRKAYCWNGHISHKGTANDSDQIRYALNADIIYWNSETISEEHKQRLLLRCSDQKVMKSGTK